MNKVYLVIADSGLIMGAYTDKKIAEALLETANLPENREYTVKEYILSSKLMRWIRYLIVPLPGRLTDY